MAVLQQALVALAASAALPASVPAYIGQYSATVAGSVATSASVGFGTASANRLIVVHVFWVPTSPVSLVSATIGGVAANLVSQSMAGPDIGGNYYGIALISAMVPTGTSGIVAATFSASPGASATFWSFSATNISTATPYSTAVPQSGAVSVLNTTVNEAAGGAVFAAVTLVATTGNVLTGVTTQYSFGTSGGVLGGSDPTPSTVANAPISFTASGSTYRCLIAASFR